jgi:bifunctional non-homologous end joining protein LigD
MDEIAAQRDRVWSSKTNAESRVKATKPAKAPKAQARAQVSGRNTNVLESLAKAVENYDASKRQFHGVRLTSPEKLLYPEQGISKLELANYYHLVADWMLPHVVNRPLVLVRCPEGRADECFYQKHPGAGTPENLRRIPVEEEGKTDFYVVADNAGGLISLAQISAVEIHGWGSRADQIDRPDRLIFDLDPDPRVPWSKVVQAAEQVRQFLEDLGLTSFVKTTGGKGLHLVVPIERRHDWDEAKDFCKRVADLIAAAAPAQFTANMAKAARTGKIYVDYLRNARGSTAVLPYSTRARPGAPVSVPLTWEELSPELPSDYYTIRNLFRRLSMLKQDPWRGMDSVRQRLTGPAKLVHQLSRRRSS